MVQPLQRHCQCPEPPRGAGPARQECPEPPEPCSQHGTTTPGDVCQGTLPCPQQEHVELTGNPASAQSCILVHEGHSADTLQKQTLYRLLLCFGKFVSPFCTLLSFFSNSFETVKTMAYVAKGNIFRKAITGNTGKLNKGKQHCLRRNRRK